MKKTKLLAAIFAAAMLLSLAPAFAQENQGAIKSNQDPRPVLTPGSDASFDKRLPPVFPGEEVSDGKNTMKVWSSSGPVPVAQAPEPWRKSGRDLPGNIGVIVDQRATPVN